MTTDIPGWVPVEHRWLGLDRRRLRPAIFVLVVALLLIYGWPALNAIVPWDNPIKAGDVLDLGDGATAVPPVGWQLEDGSLVSDRAGVSPTNDTVKLAKAGAEIQITGAAFDGTAAQFLEQVIRSEDPDANISGAPSTFTTTSGLVGVVRTASGQSGDELIAAFKMSTTEPDAAPALLVEASTVPGSFQQYSTEFQALLRSITPGAGA
ncbi:hypothetical protein JIG36_13350 [Actinoplanes sp. LDG1-06]|uniref:Uncharacterized protein n=1 Tax=Paractinoplanes ovalisporus TaxID=2810368 RepID=A0ABS2A9M7_9ACTN|nr:hypothetical protein [Actinoplanes ovalisporus]MBM2616544.1 hypothetical protein [Actinoplanes ovalisporus]